MRDNCAAGCDDPSEQAEQFLNMLRETVEGETQTYVFTGDAVKMIRHGRSLGSIKGNGFARLLLSTWMGAVPSTAKLKNALLGRR